MRVEGWERRLGDLLRRSKAVPFAWGSHDCGQWAIKGEIAVCGATRFGDLGSYTTEMGAARHIRRMGGGDLAGLVSQRRPGVPVLRAQRGDWVMGADGALGIVTGSHAAFVGAGGIITRPVSGCSHAWRIE